MNARLKNLAMWLALAAMPPFLSGCGGAAQLADVSENPSLAELDAIETCDGDKLPVFKNGVLTCDTPKPAPRLEFKEAQGSVGSPLIVNPSLTNGLADNCSASPPLPKGVLTSPPTCAIAGTPTEALEKTKFKVTASNMAGSVVAEVSLTISKASPPPPPPAALYSIDFTVKEFNGAEGYQNGDQHCANQNGAGWRMLRFHDSKKCTSGACVFWQVNSAWSKGAGKRCWTAISDQPANCGGTFPLSTKSRKGLTLTPTAQGGQWFRPASDPYFGDTDCSKPMPVCCYKAH